MAVEIPATDKSRNSRDGDIYAVRDEDLPRDAAGREERELRLLERDPSRIVAPGLSRAFSFTARRDQDQRDKERRLRTADQAIADQLQRLAEWNARKVTIAGIEMTNGQAQEARRRMIEREDECAELAARRGDIRHDQKDRFKHENRRVFELNDRDGRGILTDAERAELDRLNRSTLARARDRMTADIHQQGVEKTLAAAPSTAAPLFQSTPDLQGRFATAQAPAGPPEAAIAPAAPSPALPAKSKPLGLDL